MAEEKVRPLGNRIAALPLPPPAKSTSGRVFLLTGKDSHGVRFAQKRFKVLAPEQGIQDPKTGRWHRTTSLERGDTVICGMYPGDSVPDFKIGGEPVWFLHMGNVIAQEIE